MKQYFLLMTVLFCGNSVFCQVTINRDPQIEKMVTEVSKDSLESYIKKMVSFGH
jgi:hypothetical protein